MKCSSKYKYVMRFCCDYQISVFLRIKKVFIIGNREEEVPELDLLLVKNQETWPEQTEKH